MVADALSPGRYLRPLLLGIGDECGDGIDTARIGEGAHARVGGETVADFGRAGDAGKRADEGIVHLVMHREAHRGYAYLTGIAVFECTHQLGGAVDIGVVKHQDRHMPAKLHRRTLHMAGGERVEMLADGDRTRERELADDRIGNGTRKSPRERRTRG